jgi:NTP pyrophosphatase (non-canonical NTP hydrolase)
MEDTEVVDNEFKVGDKVVYNGPFRKDHGTVGVVVRYCRGIYYAKFPWCSYAGVHPDYLLPYKEEYKDITFESYQLEAQETAIYSGSLDIMYPALGLAGEVGETLNKVKKHYRDGTPLEKDDMTKELGDVLWYLSALATDLDIDLEEVAMENLKKLKDRQDRGVIGGSGDYR